MNENGNILSTAIYQNIAYNICTLYKMLADAVFSVSLLTCAYFMRRGFKTLHSNKRTPTQLHHIK